MPLYNHSNMRLGRKDVKHDPRTLKLARYLTTTLPAAPASLAPPNMQHLGIMLNDQLGDCTIAAAGHLIQSWSCANNNEIVIADADILAGYEKACGYDPSNPATDQGGIEVDVLNYWRTSGIGGHQISAYVALEPKSREHIKQSCFLFGGAYIGVALPVTAQNQIVWSVAIGSGGPDAEPGSWGGHAVCIVGYNDTGPICVTWGQLKQMTWLWFDVYCQEAYGVLSVDWAQAGRIAPSGFDFTTLQTDLQAVIG